MFQLESRPTDPMRLGKIMLGAVFAGVVIVGFVAPRIASYQAATLSAGDAVRHSKFPGVVEEIRGNGMAIVRTHDDHAVTVPIAELSEQ